MSQWAILEDWWKCLLFILLTSVLPTSFTLLIFILEECFSWTWGTIIHTSQLVAFCQHLSGPNQCFILLTLVSPSPVYYTPSTTIDIYSNVFSVGSCVVIVHMYSSVMNILYYANCYMDGFVLIQLIFSLSHLLYYKDLSQVLCEYYLVDSDCSWVFCDIHSSLFPSLLLLWWGSRMLLPPHHHKVDCVSLGTCVTISLGTMPRTRITGSYTLSTFNLQKPCLMFSRMAASPHPTNTWPGPAFWFLPVYQV